jgi:putative protein kinase ArgK-like GTPase of G3E family
VIFDVGARRPVRRVRTGDGPGFPAWSQDRTRIYVADRADGAVSVLSGLSFRRLTVQRLGSQLSGALRLVHGRGEWAPPVVTCSGLTGNGVPDVWQRVLAHREHLGPDGLAEKRAGQQLDFTWSLVRDELDQRLRRSPEVAAIRDEVRAAVLAGELPAPQAADRILAAYDADPRAGV